MSSHVFIDESKRHGLLVAAAVFHPRDLAPARTALRQPCLPGADCGGIRAVPDDLGLYEDGYAP